METLLSEKNTLRPGPSGQTVLDRDEILRKQTGYWRLKRVLDVLLSLIALLVLWPFMLIISAVIMIDSPGTGPIFVQERVGRDGERFRFYKFRSMVPNAEEKKESLLRYNEMDGPAFKIKEDPRITRFGRFLRRTSIDELPQLWNILRGDMSIVGPRPALPREVEQYNAYQKQRMYVTPGLTCYWQIQPHRNDLSFDEWMALDIKYIEERSLLTDFKIILKTFRAVWEMNGA